MVGKKMAFLLKRPLILIVVVIIAVVILLSASGVFSGEPQGLVLTPPPRLESDSISMGENTTLIVVIENKATRPISFELHIVYTNENLTFYDHNTGTPLQNIVTNPTNFSLTHPTMGPLDISTTIHIRISGPQPKGSSETFRIFVELYAIEDENRVLTDRKSVQLTVTVP